MQNNKDKLFTLLFLYNRNMKINLPMLLYMVKNVNYLNPLILILLLFLLFLLFLYINNNIELTNDIYK
jgi:hypothetical protein